MAKRKSGSVTVRLVYVDARDAYACTVSAQGEKPVSLDVHPSAYVTRSVDCPESYDSAARAAIAFAGEPFASLAQWETVPLGPSGDCIADRLHVERVR